MHPPELHDEVEVEDDVDARGAGGDDEGHEERHELGAGGEDSLNGVRRAREEEVERECTTKRLIQRRFASILKKKNEKKKRNGIKKIATRN